MKYLKIFNNTTDFEIFKNSDDFITPNVSFIEESNGITCNPDKIEIIELHINGGFEVDFLGFGKLYGDFSEVYNKLVHLMETKGEKVDWGLSISNEDLHKYTNITILGYNIKNMYLENGYDFVIAEFDANFAHNAINIYPDHIYVEADHDVLH